MFRRIEFLNRHVHRDGSVREWNGGLTSASSSPEVWPPSYDQLRGTGRTLPDNVRFYFTERGWREIGREIIRECGRVGQRYRVLAVKETDAQVAWRDKHTDLEVALQPRRRR